MKRGALIFSVVIVVLTATYIVVNVATNWESTVGDFGSQREDSLAASANTDSEFQGDTTSVIQPLESDSQEIADDSQDPQDSAVDEQDTLEEAETQTNDGEADEGSEAVTEEELEETEGEETEQVEEENVAVEEESEEEDSEDIPVVTTSTVPPIQTIDQNTKQITHLSDLKRSEGCRIEPIEPSIRSSNFKVRVYFDPDMHGELVYVSCNQYQRQRIGERPLLEVVPIGGAECSYDPVNIPEVLFLSVHKKTDEGTDLCRHPILHLPRWHSGETTCLEGSILKKMIQHCQDRGHDYYSVQDSEGCETIYCGIEYDPYNIDDVPSRR